MLDTSEAVIYAAYENYLIKVVGVSSGGSD